MRFFKNWFAKMCREAWEDANKTEQDSVQLVSSESIRSHGMNFTVYHASGGHVLEYNQYDEKTDRHYNRLHIIPTDQDLGQGISHIITLEMLRK